MATLREIAEKCGVSAMTVSAVLNKRRGAAGPQVRDRILTVVAETGYQAAKRSRQEVYERQNTFGVLMAYCDSNSVASDRYFGPILDGIFEAGKRQDQATLMYITEESWEQAIAKIPKYFGGRCDGVILMLPLITEDVVDSLIKQQMPFVLVGESRTEKSLSVVDLDNIGAGYTATNYLFEAGHRRIAHFCGDPMHLSSLRREQGYRKALSDWGVAVDEGLIIPGKYNIPSGYRRMTELLARNQGDFPTAAFCADDWIALGVMQAVIESGRKVPEDFSVVGINNNRESVTSQPALTTITNPLQYIGQGAVDLLMAQIRDGAASGEKSLLRGELIVRNSVSSPPGSRNAW
ncbi:MAG: LacI family DNA-binding transcriptional regulator [Fibrella sp.]|nr:LacI family DNA-binding transcriptional regulator [Armatimonadota bacterium]